MTTVSTPHSDSQSAKRYRSVVKASNSRTGCSARSAGTATKWLVAPTSMPAAFRFSWDSPSGFVLLLRLLIIASAIAVWACLRRKPRTVAILPNGIALTGASPMMQS